MMTRAICILFLTAVSYASVARAQLVGVEFNTGRFYHISTADGSLQLIDDTGITGIGSIEFNPADGHVYGITTGGSAALYRFHFSPGLDEVTPEQIGPLGLFTFEGGMAFSPDGAAYAVNGGVTVPALLSVNLTTGAASVIEFFEDRNDFGGLGWRSDGLLIGLDSTTNALLTIDPATAAVTTIEETVDPVGSLGGMALSGATGYIVTAGPLAAIPGSNSLYSFDLMTGEQFLIRDYENEILGNGLSGLAFIPEPASLALLGFGALAVLRRRSAA
jgi:hypothetical protein